MSVLYVDFGYDDNVKRELDKLSKKLESRADDYSGVRNRISDINSNTQNLYQANTYLDKKRNQLEGKIQKINRFKSAVTSFNSYASDADRRVANQIKDSRKDFCKSQGLRDGFFYTVAVAISDGFKWVKDKVVNAAKSVVNAAKKAWEWIQDFYEKNKYLIDLIVDDIALVAAVVTFVAAIASGGIPLILAAAWGVAKSFASRDYSKTAYLLHKSGRDDLAEEYSGKGMEDVLSNWFGEKWGGIIYHGLNIASFAVSMSTFISDAKYLKSVDTVASKWGDTLTPETISGIQSGGKRLLIKMTTGLDLTKFTGKTVIKNMKLFTSGAKGFATKGLAGIFGFGILKDFSGFYKDVVSIFSPSKGDALPY